MRSVLEVSRMPHLEPTVEVSSNPSRARFSGRLGFRESLDWALEPWITSVLGSPGRRFQDHRRE